MSFLAKLRKKELEVVASELGEDIGEKSKVVELISLIKKSKNCDEEIIQGIITNINADRLAEETARKEELALAEQIRKDELALAERKRKDEHELAMRKLELEGNLQQQPVASILQSSPKINWIFYIF